MRLAGEKTMASRRFASFAHILSRRALRAPFRASRTIFSNSSRNFSVESSVKKAEMKDGEVKSLENIIKTHVSDAEDRSEMERILYGGNHTELDVGTEGPSGS
mmetsp:Transcript_13665/g.20588  ORF Transcript_13665/g.20588 Transcript_13665/m.20588 type:complete len:103 (-) Transcript_13665:1104-1412(-)